MASHRHVILAMTVLRRLDAVLELAKRAVLDTNAALDAGGVSLPGGSVPAFTGPATVNCEHFDQSGSPRRRLPAPKER